MQWLHQLKPYILVYDPFELPRDEILDFFDNIPDIKNYYAFLPSGIIIISTLPIRALSDRFRNQFVETEFIICELDSSKIDGWLDEDVWNFIDEARSSGRW